MYPVAQSVSAFGSATAPAADAAVATLAAVDLPAGRYLVESQCAYGGTAGLINDMNLRAGATVIHRLMVAAAVATPAAVVHRAVVTLDGSTALTVNAVTGGVALSVYTANIIATRIRS